MLALTFRKHRTRACFGRLSRKALPTTHPTFGWALNDSTSMVTCSIQRQGIASTKNGSPSGMSTLLRISMELFFLWMVAYRGKLLWRGLQMARSSGGLHFGLRYLTLRNFP